jgi:hypothetical protein
MGYWNVNCTPQKRREGAHGGMLAGRRHCVALRQDQGRFHPRRRPAAICQSPCVLAREWVPRGMCRA